jgi:hypothetical protein
MYVGIMLGGAGWIQCYVGIWRLVDGGVPRWSVVLENVSEEGGILCKC